MDDVLRELATAYSIDTEYWDWQGTLRPVTEATLRSVLAAFEVDASTPRACAAALDARRATSARILPPTVVVPAGRATAIEPAGPVVAASVELEDGLRRALALVDGAVVLPDDLPAGYHHLITVPAGAQAAPVRAHLIVAPARLDPPVGTEPGWGLAVQLYSVRSQRRSRSWGTGDLGDLAELARWSAAGHGADFVLVNPLHAAEVVAPITASPYLPTSRRFANPLYLRVASIAEWDAVPADVRDGFVAEGDALRERGDLLDRDAVWALKLRALEAVYAVGRSDRREAEFQAFCAREGEALDRFATWCALTELHGPRWPDWPAELHDPAAPAVARAVAGHAERVGFHRWLQWQLDDQLRRTQQVARGAGMRLGIIGDVAVGVNPHGADSWMYRNVLAAGVTVGAPADAYSQTGQDWEQPPWRPDRLAELGYAPLRDLFRAALRHCGGLRVDHILGMFRLWWIPDGARAAEGTYVRYDDDALLGILALEADRAGAVLIGEDLGNVEPRVRDRLRERRLFGTSILWFERDTAGAPLPPERWRRLCLASVTTHDLPPTIGYLAGDHVRLRHRLGLLTRPLEDELAADEADKQTWLAELRRRGLLPWDREASADEIVLALHALLPAAPSLLRCVALTDAVGERRTQNQPGTRDEYPNWQMPLGDEDGSPVWLEDLLDGGRLAERAARVVRAAGGR